MSSVGRARGRHTLVTAVALAGCLLAGCGVQATSSASGPAATPATRGPVGTAPATPSAPTTPDTPPTTDLPGLPSIPSLPSIPPGVKQRIIETYMRMGLTRPQATCLAGGMLDALRNGGAGQLRDLQAMGDLLRRCHVDLSQLSPDFGFGGGGLGGDGGNGNGPGGGNGNSNSNGNDNGPGNGTGPGGGTPTTDRGA